MTLLDAWSAVVRYWWLVVVVLLLAAAPAYFLSAGQSDRYESSGRLVLGPVPLDAEGDLVDSAAALDRGSFTATLAEIVRSTGTHHRAAIALDLPSSVVERYDIDSAVIPETNVVEVYVVGPDPELAHLLADQVAQESAASFSSLYPIYQAELLSQPERPVSPIGTGPVPDSALLVAAGLLVGIVAAVALDRTRRGRIRLDHIESLTLHMGRPEVDEPAHRREDDADSVG